MYGTAIAKFSDRVNIASKWIEMVERRKLAAIWSDTVADVLVAPPAHACGCHLYVCAVGVARMRRQAG